MSVLIAWRTCLGFIRGIGELGAGRGAALLLCLIVLAACGPAPETEKQSVTAPQLRENVQAKLDVGDYAAALVVAQTLSKRYPKSPEAIAIAAQLPEIQAGAEKQRAAARKDKEEAKRAKTFQKVSAFTSALKDLNAGAIPKTGWDGAQLLLETFNKTVQVIREAGLLAPLTESERAQVAALKTLLVKRQTEVFPSLRKVGAKEIDTKLWESNVDVAAVGSRSSTISFVGGVFASNKNIADAQKAFDPLMTRLRFKKSQYRWIPSEDEFTYYDLKNPADGDVVEVSTDGVVVQVDTTFLGGK